MQVDVQRGEIIYVLTLCEREAHELYAVANGMDVSELHWLLGELYNAGLRLDDGPFDRDAFPNVVLK